jgi:hypothetical protein
MRILATLNEQIEYYGKLQETVKGLEERKEAVKRLILDNLSKSGIAKSETELFTASTFPNHKDYIVTSEAKAVLDQVVFSSLLHTTHSTTLLVKRKKLVEVKG